MVNFCVCGHSRGKHHPFKWYCLIEVCQCQHYYDQEDANQKRQKSRPLKKDKEN